jgi:hypothetical protein
VLAIFYLQKMRFFRLIGLAYDCWIRLLLLLLTVCFKRVSRLNHLSVGPLKIFIFRE